MYRYLLYDSGCGICAHSVGQIKEEVDGILTVRGLSEMEIQQYLNRAKPDWEWEPMLLEVSEDGEEIRVYNGVFMRLRLIQLLGISKSWRVLSSVYQSVNTTISAPERRRFLKYSGGVVAGLAVVGLRPLQSHAELVLENPDSDEKATVKELSGPELQDALDEASSRSEFDKFATYFSERGYNTDNTSGTAVLIESKSRTPILIVSIQFVNPATDDVSAVKYQRHGTQTSISAGAIHKTDDVATSVDMHEVVSGSVKHTRTVRRNSDGSVVDEPVGQNSGDSHVIVPPGDNLAQNSCNDCLMVCGTLYAALCGGTGAWACVVICPTMGPLAGFCAVVCGILWAMMCFWQGTWTCNKACKWLGYCN